MRESIVETYLKNMVKNNGGKCIKWTAPGERGVPDRLVLWPEGHIDMVELKAPNGRLSALQVNFQREMSLIGHKVYVATSIQAVEDYVNKRVVELYEKGDTHGH